MIDDPRRNPYLVLGVEFGAGATEANRAFAKRSRAARRGEGTLTLDDLTWALHEIEHAEAHPSDLILHFRLPADPGACRSPWPEGPALPVKPLERRSPQLTQDDLAELRGRAIAELARKALAPLPFAPLVP